MDLTAAVPREDPSHQRLAVRRLSQRAFRHVRRLGLQRVALGCRQASRSVVAAQRRVGCVGRVHDPQVHVARGRERHRVADDRGRGRGVRRGRSRDDGRGRPPSHRRAVRRARRGIIIVTLERPPRLMSRAVVRCGAGERGCGRGRAAPRSREMRGRRARERYHRPTQRRGAHQASARPIRRKT